MGEQRYKLHVARNRNWGSWFSGKSLFFWHHVKF